MHYKLSHLLPLKDADIKSAFGNSKVVFDTNVYLGLYRFSGTTKLKLKEILLDLVKNSRLNVPQICIYEFLSNRIGVIRDQIDRNSKLLSMLEKLIANSDKGEITLPTYTKISNSQDIITLDSFSFSLDAIAKINESFTKLKEELTSNISKLEGYISEDPELNFLIDNDIFSVNSYYSETEVEETIACGKIRYEKKIPPGYEDAKDKVSSVDKLTIKPYGDVRLWLDVLEIDCDVILTTNDNKKDWFNRVDGKISGPRIELNEEFKQKHPKNKLLVYTTDRFVQNYFDFVLKAPLTEEEVEEIYNDFSPNSFEELTKEELLLELNSYSQQFSNGADGYIPLRKFVISHLGQKGYKFNSSYNLINSLHAANELIKIYTKEDVSPPITCIKILESQIPNLY